MRWRIRALRSTRLPLRKPLLQHYNPPPQPGNPHQRHHHAHRHSKQHQDRQHDYRFQRTNPEPASSRMREPYSVRPRLGSRPLDQAIG
ncbi:hypothetical protein KWS_0113330 [Xanthomonas vasicola pv. musacearum NCPPB 4384]|nr:hypothetical protein KWS_0113330 [Xanthomonas vasicola pv. musacearum NCPPB 4384]